MKAKEFVEAVMSISPTLDQLVKKSPSIEFAERMLRGNTIVRFNKKWVETGNEINSDLIDCVQKIMKEFQTTLK